ncbi:MAG: carboxypeptidase-like regulatory domain-containing protein [Mucilaginibacter sp.]|nr:carboxypeptidase-like regulatory domain-containing protein [Mucilaginibacter sp.]
MKDKRADISQIQAYLKGELDSKAMHQLEREAQADPFLADAMDGYANTAGQQDNLAALQKRLQQRVEPKVRRVLPWTTIAIAASVVGFVIVAGLFFMRNDSNRLSRQVAINEPAKAAPLTIAPAPLADSASAETEKETFATPRMKKSKGYTYNTPSVSKPSHSSDLGYNNEETRPALAEADKSEYNNPSPAVSDDFKSNYMANKRQDTILGGEHIAINKNPSAVTIINSKAVGATYKERDRQSASSTAALMAANLPTGLTGKVLDNSGLPLPGASVKIVGKPAGTVTDANGRFTLREVKPDDQIAYDYLGYDKKVLPAKIGDSVKVMLNESNASLAEVVVTQVAKRNGSKAAPIIGWSAYNDYLKREAVTEEGEKTGPVELTFTVEANGNISDIKITKASSAGTDKKAIALIQNGPRWFGNLNRKPEVVRVTVKFAHED